MYDGGQVCICTSEYGDVKDMRVASCLRNMLSTVTWVSGACSGTVRSIYRVHTEYGVRGIIAGALPLRV